jgi:F0F1-type ATP synthase assembly protein I
MSTPAPQRPSPEGRDGPIEEAQAWSLVSYLLAGLITFGGLGLLLDRWLGTSWLVLVGLLAGAGLAFYLIWFRYGTR